MTSLIETLTMLAQPERTEIRIRCFARVKKLKDVNASREENEITDLFLAMAGCEAVKETLTMAYPRELEGSTYEEMVRIIKKNNMDSWE